MSRQPQDMPGFAPSILAAFAECEMSARKLYAGYYLAERFEIGLGKPKHGEGEDAFGDWMKGTSEPRISQYCLVARALNKRLGELGKDPMLPEIPFPKTISTPDGGGESTEITGLGSADTLDSKGQKPSLTTDFTERMAS